MSTKILHKPQKKWRIIRSRSDGQKKGRAYEKFTKRCHSKNPNQLNNTDGDILPIPFKVSQGQRFRSTCGER